MNILRSKFIFMIILIILNVLSCQNAIKNSDENITFVKRYGGENGDYGHDIIIDNNGGYNILGETYSYGNGENDIWLIKTDFEGNIEWEKTIGGSDNDVAQSTLKTDDNGFIMTGQTISYGEYYQDTWVVKANLNGDEEWIKTYGSEETDYGRKICKAGDNGYIVAGITYSNEYLERDIRLIKIDLSGNVEWDRDYGGQFNDTFCDMCEDINGGYIILGTTGSYSSIGRDIWIIRINTDGDTLWTKTYDFGGNEYSGYICQASDYGYVYNYRSGSEIVIVKIDSTGIQKWMTSFSFSDEDNCGSVQLTSDNGFIIVGGTDVYHSDNGKVFLLKTDSNGTEIWRHEYDIFEDYHTIERGISVKQTDDLGYIIIGDVYSPDTRWDILLIKTDKEGNI